MNTSFQFVGRKLVSGSALRIFNLVGSAASSFFLMPFIVHHLGDRIYGFWSLAAGFIGYYNILDLGLSSAISQYMCIAMGQKDENECQIVFNTALRLQLLIACAALVITAALAVATPWFCHHPEEVPVFRMVIIILGVNAAISFPIRAYWATLEAHLRFDLQSWPAIIALALRTGMIVWVVFAGGGLLGLAWAALLSTLPANLLLLWFARREAAWVRVGSSFVRKEKIRSLFSYSGYSFMAYIADIVRFQVDPLVITALIGLAAVTHYKVAAIMTQYYLQIISFSVGMFLPVLSRLYGAGNHRDLNKVFFFGTKLSCWIAVSICFTFIGWGRPFIVRWMGPEYLDGYLPLVILSVAVLLDVCQRSSSDLLFATFKHRSYAAIDCAEAVINLGLSLLLARPFGILGVAIGTFAGAFVIRVLVQPSLVCHLSGIDYFSYLRFLWGNLFRCGCIAATSIGVCAWGLKPQYLYLVLSALCALAVYAAGTWLIVFNRTDRDYFKAALRKRLSAPSPYLVGVGDASGS